MKRSTHPEAYDYFIKMGDTPEQMEGYWASYVIGVWEAHADLRAAGKLPAVMLESVEVDESYDPSVLTEEELQLIESIRNGNDYTETDIMNTIIEE